MDALRKIYHRAVQIPLENVEILWSELETFENNLNRITASTITIAASAANPNCIHPGEKVFE
jgi:cleavage stimulation factor subunit 3